MISDKAFEMSPTKKRLLHSHMKHHESMANRSYVLKLNAQRASRTHKLVQGINHDSSTTNPSAPLPAVAPNEGNIFSTSKSDSPLPAVTPSIDDSDDDKPLGVILGNDEPMSTAEDDDDQPLHVAAKKGKKGLEVIGRE